MAVTEGGPRTVLTQMSLPKTLRGVPLFSKLRDSDLERLAPLFVEREYPRNRVIRFAHDPSDALYVVIRGQVKVMLIAEDGREVVLSLVREGDFFGETALLDDEPYAASVIAMEDSRLLVLPWNSYHVAATDPERCAQATLEFIGGHRIAVSQEG